MGGGEGSEGKDHSRERAQTARQPPQVSGVGVRSVFLGHTSSNFTSEQLACSLDDG